MKRFLAALMAAALLSGCSLIPKPVELFQDKVKTVPEKRQADKEIQRQVAQRAEEKARETYGAALTTFADPTVVLPAAETVLLTDAVSESVGPPVHPASPNKATEDLVRELRTSIAKLEQRLDAFKADNNENAGKKIEGTGLFQIPYFVWLGGFLVLGFIGFIVLAVLWTALKAFAMTNPPVQLGVQAAQLGAGFLKRTLSEVVAGGEKFKEKIVSEVEDPELQEKIKTLFRTEHEKAQSDDAKNLIQIMTRKE